MVSVFNYFRTSFQNSIMPGAFSHLGDFTVVVKYILIYCKIYPYEDTISHTYMHRGINRALKKG